MITVMSLHIVNLQHYYSSSEAMETHNYSFITHMYMHKGYKVIGFVAVVTMHAVVVVYTKSPDLDI